MNKVIVKKFTVLAAAMMCMCTAAVSAYASPVLTDETERVHSTVVLDRPVLVEETVRQVYSIVEVLPGDVNGDGKVNISDITLTVAHVKGIKLLDNISAADLNGDSVVDISDVALLSAMVKGKG